MSGHTKGPWRVGKIRPSGMTRLALIDPAGTVASFTRSDAALEANARLIAAAPDLLAALEDFCDAFPGEKGLDNAMKCGLDAELIGARAAIAKARS